MRTYRLPQGRVAGLLAGAALCAMAGTALMAQEVKKGGTLNVAIETDVRGFDGVEAADVRFDCDGQLTALFRHPVRLGQGRRPRQHGQRRRRGKFERQTSGPHDIPP